MNPCPRWPINPKYHGLISTQSIDTTPDVSYLLHRARCDSSDGSLSSSSAEYISRLVEREIVDSSDDE
jgi:hypothetical protein